MIVAISSRFLILLHFDIEWLSLFLHLRINKVKVTADLGQSIGKAQFQIENIFSRFGFPGRLQKSSR